MILSKVHNLTYVLLFLYKKEHMFLKLSKSTGCDEKNRNCFVKIKVERLRKEENK